MSNVIRMKKMNLRGYLRELKSENLDFNVRVTGYSSTVSYENNGEVVKHIMSDTNNFMLLGAYAKIKANAQKINKKVPYYTDPTYYLVGSETKAGSVSTSKSSPPLFQKVLNIDIKSAYPNCLLNNGFIDKATFNYLEKVVRQKIRENFAKKNKIPLSKISDDDEKWLKDRWKEVRLKSVGMLATRTLDVSYVKGKYGKSVWKHTKLEKNDYLRSIFLFAQYEIGRVMKKIAKAYGKDFLFMWVDGIYVKREAGTKKADNILKEFGYRYSTTILRNFRVWREITKGIPENNPKKLRYRPGGKELIKIDFLKNKKSKPFSVPTGKMVRHW